MPDDCASIESIAFQALIIFAVLACVSVVYFVFIFSWCKQRTDTTRAHKVIKNTREIKLASFIALTLYFTSCVQFTIFSSFDLSQTNCNSGRGYGFATNLSAFYTLLIVFSLRIIKTFENTIYAFNQTQIKCLKIWLIIPVIVFCGTFVVSVGVVNDEQRIEMVGMLGTVFMIIVCVLLLFIIYVMKREE